jgi:hypothetical protein
VRNTVQDTLTGFGCLVSFHAFKGFVAIRGLWCVLDIVLAILYNTIIPQYPGPKTPRQQRGVFVLLKVDNWVLTIPFRSAILGVPD